MGEMQIKALGKYLKKLASERVGSGLDPEDVAKLADMLPETAASRVARAPAEGAKLMEYTRKGKPKRAKEVGKTIKPRMNLSSPQWQKMVERIILKSEGTPGAGDYKVRSGGLPQEYGGEARQMMDELSPATRRIYSRLNTRRFLGADEFVNQPKDFPYGEAVEKLAARPDVYSPERYKLPTGNIMSFGDNPGFEERMYRPVGDVVERARAAAEAVRADLAKEGNAKALTEEAMLRGQVGKINPTAGGSTAAEAIQKVTGQSAEDASVDLIRQGVALDQIWKYLVKGMKSSTGKYWQTLQRRRGGMVSKLHTRDYFLRQGLKWLENPEAFAQRYPNEADSLRALWAQMEGVAGIGE